MKKHSISNEELRNAFLDRMAGAGMPLERVNNGHGGNQLYQITVGDKAGKRVRVRTNRRPAVMSLASGVDWADPIALVTGAQDFVGISFVTREGAIDTYLVPTDRVVADMREEHRAAVQARGGHSGSKVRILYFDERQRNGVREQGYAERYAEFRVKPVESQLADESQPVAGTTEDALLQELHDDLVGREKRWIEVRGTPGSQLLAMIARVGVVKAIDRHLALGSFGNSRTVLTDVIEAGCSHLTVEASVLNPKYQSLFTVEQRQCAWNNLFGRYRSHDLSVGIANHEHTSQPGTKCEMVVSSTIPMSRKLSEP
jgi:hypothetical protein